MKSVANFTLVKLGDYQKLLNLNEVREIETNLFFSDDVLTTFAVVFDTTKFFFDCEVMMKNADKDLNSMKVEILKSIQNVIAAGAITLDLENIVFSALKPFTFKEPK